MNDNSTFKLFVDGFIDDFLELLSNYVTDFIYSGEKNEDKSMERATKQVDDLIKKIDDFETGKQAEERRKYIEKQLNSSKYGVAYTDGTERVGAGDASGVCKIREQVKFGDEFAKQVTNCVIYNLKRDPKFLEWIEDLVEKNVNECKDDVQEPEFDSGRAEIIRHAKLIEYASRNNEYWGMAVPHLCMEEMSELTQALCKYERDDDQNQMKNIIDEMGDVYICLEMLKQFLGIQEEAIWDRIVKKCEEKRK